MVMICDTVVALWRVLSEQKATNYLQTFSGALKRKELLSELIIKMMKIFDTEVAM